MILATPQWLFLAEGFWKVSEACAEVVMSARSLADLQDSCQASQAELLRIRKEIQNAGKRKRRAEKTALQEHRPLTAFMKIAAVLVLVFVLADHTVEVATAFAIGKGRKRRRLLHDADDVQAQIELEYINMPTDKVVDLLSEPLTPQIQRLIIPASKHVVEHRLFQWVVDQNCEKGVAPSGRLLQEAMKFIPASAPGHVRQSLMDTFGSQGRSSRKWLASFRRRWGARIGKMKIRFGMDMSEVREKARGKIMIVSGCENDLLCGPIFGTFFENRFWDRLLVLIYRGPKNRTRFRAHFLGPENVFLLLFCVCLPCVCDPVGRRQRRISAGRTMCDRVCRLARAP